MSHLSIATTHSPSLLTANSESHGESCRQAVFTHCVELLNSDQLQSKTAQELVGKLLVEVSKPSGIPTCKPVCLHLVYLCLSLCP